MTFTICLLLFLWKRVVVVDVGRKKALGSGYGIRGVHCFGGLACNGVGGAGWMEKRTLRSWATPLICANHINLGPYWRVWRNRRWASDWGIWACFRIPIVEQKPVTYTATKKGNVIVVIRFRTALHPRAEPATTAISLARQPPPHRTMPTTPSRHAQLRPHPDAAPHPPPLQQRAQRHLPAALARLRALRVDPAVAQQPRQPQAASHWILQQLLWRDSAGAR
jgi:hypothetical protein